MIHRHEAGTQQKLIQAAKRTRSCGAGRYVNIVDNQSVQRAFPTKTPLALLLCNVHAIVPTDQSFGTGAVWHIRVAYCIHTTRLESN
jgi:hypothetical protein